MQNKKDFVNDEFKKEVTSIIETLKSFLNEISSVQDVISLYSKGSNEIDGLKINIQTKRIIKHKLGRLPRDRDIDIQINEDVFRVSSSEIVINMLQTFYNAYNKYQLKFTNEDAFNDEIFLDFLVSKSIKHDSGQGWSLCDEGRVFMSTKKLLRIGYSAPYIVKLILKVNISDVVEKDDLKKLIKALLKKDGLYADHLNDLLSIETASEKINLYEIVCDVVIEKNLTFKRMRSVFKTPQHVQRTIDELIEKAKQPENTVKVAELIEDIVKLTNNIACNLYRIGDYHNALEILFNKEELINGEYIKKEDTNLLCAKSIEAKIKNQQGTLEENTKQKIQIHTKFWTE